MLQLRVWNRHRHDPLVEPFCRLPRTDRAVLHLLVSRVSQCDIPNSMIISPRLLLLGALSPSSPSPAKLMTSTPEKARKMLPSVTRLRGCLSKIIEKKYAKKAELA